MSTVLAATSSAGGAAGTSSTKRNMKSLSSGHTISLTSQEERMLRRVYDYMQGYFRRTHLQNRLEQAKAEFNRLFALVPAHVRSIKGDVISFKNFYEGDQPTETEQNTEAFMRVRERIRELEEQAKRMESVDFTISLGDIEAILKKLGTPKNQKELEFMIWEVDENNDGSIDWEEFQLTYYRNIMDTTGSEPCSFFNILEFLTFDDSNKGYIIEDNCMEILFARYGSQKLENELQFLFGSQLRSAGGDGTLTLSQYLSAILTRTGRRAIVAA